MKEEAERWSSTINFSCFYRISCILYSYYLSRVYGGVIIVSCLFGSVSSGIYHRDFVITG